MISNLHNHHTFTGKWKVESCTRKNAVCQKLPFWSIDYLKQLFLNIKRTCDNTQSEFKKIQAKFIQASTDLNKAVNKIEILQNNPVPIGFIYIQLPLQETPHSLWPNLQWKDVTFKYSGLFFRAYGNGSGEFGISQEENAPRVTQVQLERHEQTKNGDPWFTTNLNTENVSSGIGVFAGFDKWGKYGFTHKFHMSGGEIRPKNMAVFFWIRIG